MFSCPTSTDSNQKCSAEVYVVQHNYESFKQCMCFRLSEDKNKL